MKTRWRSIRRCVGLAAAFRPPYRGDGRASLAPILRLNAVRIDRNDIAAVKTPADEMDEKGACTPRDDSAACIVSRSLGRVKKRNGGNALLRSAIHCPALPLREVMRFVAANRD